MSESALFLPDSAGERFGEVIRTRRAGDFQFRESRYPRGLATPAHYHPRAYLCYVAEGRIAERDPRGEARYTTGTMHFHPAGHPHSVSTHDSGFASLSIVPFGDAGPSLESALGPGEPLAPRSSMIAARCRSELRLRDAASDLALEGLAHELIAVL